MSRENVEVVEQVCYQVYDAVKRGDLDAFVALHDPDASLIPLILDIEGGGYHGHEGVRSFWRDIHSAFPDWHWEPERIRVLDEGALVTLRIRGRATGSGVTIDQRAWHAIKLRGRKVIWWQIFRSEEAALEAIGPGE